MFHKVALCCRVTPSFSFCVCRFVLRPHRAPWRLSVPCRIDWARGEYFPDALAEIDFILRDFRSGDVPIAPRLPREDLVAGAGAALLDPGGVMA